MRPATDVNANIGNTGAPARGAAPPSVPRLALGDRILIWGGLGAVTLLAWLYLVRMPMAPSDLGAFGARVATVMPPGWAQVWLTFMMWAVMMVAMMLPSASPMVMTYARIAHGRQRTAPWHVWLFALGYVAVWMIFSVVATAVQDGLQRLAIVTNALTVAPLVGGIILVAAGVYQFTPLKEACLGKCRSPIGFFMTEWRDGARGALAMGFKHGALCVGCCWMLMVLLFVAGVMNLLWIAAISVFVLLEKAIPYRRAITNATGAALIILGAAVAYLG
ncbi:MAG: DUF2182 domain-containing protein [Candidatus Binataceae bacterium]